MPLVYNSKGLKGWVRTREKNHRLPHVHFEYGKYALSAELSDEGLTVLGGNLPTPQMRQLRKDFKNEKLVSEILGEWSRIHGPIE